MLKMIVLWFFFFTLAIWFIIFRYRRRHMYKLAAQFPKHGSELPVIGVAHNFYGSMEDVMLTMQNYSYEAMQKGGIISAWFGPQLYFLAVDPVDVEMVLKKCLEKNYIYRFLKSALGNGTITAPVKCHIYNIQGTFLPCGIAVGRPVVSIWGRRRKVLDKTFTLNVVEGTAEVLYKNSKKLTMTLDNCTDLGKIELWPLLSKYSFTSLFESAVDMQLNLEPIYKAFKCVQEIISDRLFHLWLHPDWLFRLFPQFYEFGENMAMIHERADELVKIVRETKRSTEEYKTTTDPGSAKTVKVAEHMLKFSGDGDEGYTDEELRDELITLAAAGTDSTAATIGFTLKLLGKYPEIQDKLHQELHAFFGDSDRPLVKANWRKLNYLDRVVKESLRLFPPVPLLTRKVVEDTKLPSGRVLPAGSSVCVSIWGAHRDPKYWGPDAENFDPDRFLPERLNLAHACSYMPFSFGRRNCVANRYALVSVKNALSAIIRRYRVVGDIETSPAPQMRVKFDIIMKAVDKYEVQLEKRK